MSLNCQPLPSWNTPLSLQFSLKVLISSNREDLPEKTQRMDEYVFSALPINGYYDGDDCGYSFYSVFWSFSEDSSGSPYGLYICNDWNPAKIARTYKEYSFAVRCIKG